MKKNTLKYLYSLPKVRIPSSFGFEASLPIAISNSVEDGNWAEFGVGIGYSFKFLLNLLPENKKLYVFDSFEGLPEDWTEFTPEHTKGHWSDIDKTEIISIVGSDERLQLYDGWFKDTAPKFAVDTNEYLSIVHIDGDLYSSCIDVLYNIDKLISPGTIIAFDEYYNYGGLAWKKHEYKAFREYIKDFDRDFEYIARTNSYQVVVRITR